MSGPLDEPSIRVTEPRHCANEQSQNAWRNSWISNYASCPHENNLCLTRIRLQSQLFMCISRTRNSNWPWTLLALSQGRTCAKKNAMTSPPQQMHAQMHAWIQTALQGLVNKWAHQLFDACLVNLSISESAFAKCPKQAFGTPKQVWKPLGPSVDAIFGLALL